MTVAESINKAISEGDIKGIRIMMKNSLLVDPSFAEFDEMTRIAGNMPGLYDAHDGRELNGDKSAWNDDYMDKLMVQVVGNFSHERLDHLKEVVRHLRPVAARTQPSTSTGRTVTGQRPSGRPFPPREGSSDHGVKIAVSAAGGGVAGGVIAGVAGGSVLIGAVAGAVIAGAAVAVVTNGK